MRGVARGGSGTPWSTGPVALALPAALLPAAASAWFGANVDSDLSGNVHAEGALGPEVPSGTFRVTTTAGTVSTEKIPALTIEGHVDAPRVIATLKASEPGVALSGYGMEADLQQTKEAGFSAHLTKPIQMEELLN